MIAFVDESYHNGEDGTVLAVVGGVLIDEYRYRALETAFYMIRLELARIVYAPDGLLEDEIVARSRDLEIKGANCLKAKYLDPAASLERRAGPRAALNALLAAEECRARFILATARLDNVAQIHGTGETLPAHYRALLAQIALVATNPDRPVVVAFDSVHGRVDRGFTKRMSDYLYRGAESETYRHFVPVPFCIPSDTTAGSQVADFVCRVQLLRELGNPKTTSAIADHAAVVDRRRVRNNAGDQA